MERKLTDTKIKKAKAKPNGKDNILADGGGLAVYVTAKNNRYWRYTYRYEGKT
jgi:phage pi2 protein 07